MGRDFYRVLYRNSRYCRSDFLSRAQAAFQHLRVDKGTGSIVDRNELGRTCVLPDQNIEADPHRVLPALSTRDHRDNLRKLAPRNRGLPCLKVASRHHEHNWPDTVGLLEHTKGMRNNWLATEQSHLLVHSIHARTLARGDENNR